MPERISKPILGVVMGMAIFGAKIFSRNAGL
jgi:hypothetical protein